MGEAPDRRLLRQGGSPIRRTCRALRELARGPAFETLRRLAVLIELRHFRDERGPELGSFRIVVALQITHACREPIPGRLDRRHGVDVIDFPGGVQSWRPEFPAGLARDGMSNV
jgi:hypothetical protein